MSRRDDHNKSDSKSSRPLRIGVARLNQESHALSPLPTTFADFRTQHWLEGAEILKGCRKGAWEVAPFIKNAELSGFVQQIERMGVDVELVPLVDGWCVPGGPLEQASFDEMCELLTDRLTDAGPLDGMYLSLHGALGVAGVRDPETRLLERVRAVIGDDVPLATSYDLHGNLTRERVELTDILVAYRTNPHRDHASTGARAARLLVKTLTGEIKPRLSWRTLPMLIGGGTTLDFVGVMRGCFTHLKKIERDELVLDASIFMCHPYNDDPALGWSCVVMTDDAVELGERHVEEIADKLWATRHVQPPAFASAEEAIAKVRGNKWLRKLGCITVSDVSDVVTTGTTGDSTHMLKAVLDHGQGLRCYCPLRDPVATRKLFELEPGDAVDVEVGACFKPALSDPLRIQGKLRSKHTFKGYDKTVVVDLDHVQLVISEGPALVLQPKYYRQVGLDLLRADLVVVKNFFPYLLFFAPFHRWTYFAKTRGLSDFDVAFGLERDGPVFPVDEVADWRDADRRRRLGPALRVAA